MTSPQIAKLLSVLKQPAKTESNDSAEDFYVKVNELAKKAGMFYEKIRYLIDYKEEHTIRRNAIQRILSRNLFFKSEGKKVATLLIQELLRGGYLGTGTFLESRIYYVQGIIDKFLSLEKSLIYITGGDLTVKKIIISLAASEIESYLFGNKIEESVIDSFYEIVREKIHISQIVIDEDYKNTQIFIACLRSFLRADEHNINYRLWIKYVPNWTNARNISEIEDIAKMFLAIQSKISEEIKDELNWQLARKLKNHGIYFSLIKEIAERYGADSEQVFLNPQLLEKEAKNILENKYKKENNRIRKSALRAVFYILLTKTILAFFLELPYDLAVLGKIYYPALAINVIFHPFLLFAITYTIRPLGMKNTEVVIAGLSSVVYEKDTQAISIRGRKRRNLLYAVFLILYTLIFFVSFGIVIFILDKLNFNLMSIVLFTFFLTLVTYFGLRIRYVSKNWTVNSGKERTLYFLGNILIMPIVEVGRWFSRKFESINILVFIMDFIIETPFKLLLNVFDSFISFLKEKREEMY